MFTYYVQDQWAIMFGSILWDICCGHANYLNTLSMRSYCREGERMKGGLR